MPALRTGIARILNRFPLRGFACDKHLNVLAAEGEDLFLQTRGAGEDGHARDREIRISDHAESLDLKFPCKFSAQFRKCCPRNRQRKWIARICVRLPAERLNKPNGDVVRRGGVNSVVQAEYDDVMLLNEGKL